jgi:hypothetical protein
MIGSRSPIVTTSQPNVAGDTTTIASPKDWPDGSCWSPPIRDFAAASRFWQPCHLIRPGGGPDNRRHVTTDSWAIRRDPAPSLPSVFRRSHQPTMPDVGRCLAGVLSRRGRQPLIRRRARYSMNQDNQSGIVTGVETRKRLAASRAAFCDLRQVV